METYNVFSLDENLYVYEIIVHLPFCTYPVRSKEEKKIETLFQKYFSLVWTNRTMRIRCIERNTMLKILLECDTVVYHTDFHNFYNDF